MKNEYKVTWEIFKSWGQESAFKPPKLYMVIFWCVIAAASLVMGVVFTAKGAMAFISPDSLLFSAFFLFSIYRAFFRNILASRKQYETLANRYQTKDWIRTILFNDDDIEIVEGGNTYTVCFDSGYHAGDKNKILGRVLFEDTETDPMKVYSIKGVKDNEYVYVLWVYDGYIYKKDNE